MRTTHALALGLLLFTLINPARAADTPIKGKIVAVDLFKNGLAVVKQELTLGKPGAYTLDDFPTPVHGTFWVETTGPVETSSKMRDVAIPSDEAGAGNLQDDLSGKTVTIHLRGEKREPVVGTIIKLKPPKGEATEAATRMLIIQTATGRTYVSPGDVASLEAKGDAGTVTRRRPQMIFTLGVTEKPETKVTLRYLTHGLTWAPHYRIDISDPKSLMLEQHATVRNDLVALEGAEVRLISGYPSVQFGHVTSLLTPRMTLAGFFSQIAGSGGRNDYQGSLSNSVMTQGLFVGNPGMGIDAALGATPTGEGIDLHYQPIGKRTLAEGETLALTVANGKADYERIIEWLIPDNRNAYGQYEGRGRGESAEEDEAWDALKFKNPLKFPMTTGPATVTAGGQFNGQRSTQWVNVGEETVLRVNKALSIRTRAVEHEEPGNDAREFVWVGGRQYRKTTVKGEVSVSNHRKETVPVLIRRRFSGDLIAAEGDPKSSLREEGVFSVNKRNELLWTVPLKAGEEKTLKYSYTVLVPH